MSHLVCSQIKIADLDILKKTVAGFGGLTWNEGATTFESYYSGEPCEHSITIKKGQYEVGVRKSPDGDGYNLVFDPYDSEGAKVVGHSCEKVAGAYGEAFVRDFAERNGFILDHATDSEGNMVLTMTDNR